MYNLSKYFEKFYKNDVVLPNDKQNELREKKNLNIERLKKGLEDYNDENNTNYKISETRVQGSMAMHTVVQNDSNDYDIDVAIVFEKDNLNDKGPLEVRNIIADALKRKCTNFKNDPEVKTNCVRIEYQDGYHVDFAVYRRYKKDSENEYTYEHAGSSWTSRNPAAINNWFADEIKDKGQSLRKVIRLSKMFCKSRESWINMPGGLIQTMLCDEKIQTGYKRLDEIFYYTMIEIKNRLDSDIEVYNPTDESLSLLLTESHRQKVKNYRNRLNEKLEKLDVLFEDDCDEKRAKNAWYEFFNHEYWNKNSVELKSYSQYCYDNTEEFIEDIVNINEQNYVKISAEFEGNGFRTQPLNRILERFNCKIPHKCNITFSIANTDIEEPYNVWWKVRNVGTEAEKRNMIRGQIEKNRGYYIKEPTSFGGPHYVECYIIKNNECVAIGHISVPIAKE